MLDLIKEQVRLQEEYLESMALIYEDATSLDNMIVLTEAKDDLKDDDSDKEDAKEEKDSKQDEDESSETEDLLSAPLGDDNDVKEEPEEVDHPSAEDDDILNTTIGEAPEPVDDTTMDDAGAEDDLLSTPIDGTEDMGEEPVVGEGETPLPLPGDDLPAEPVDGGAPTGPMNKEDLLSAAIDLKSNTLKDILPIPPAGAVDSVIPDESDDTMNTHVDAGFGGEDDDLLNTPIDGTEDDGGDLLDTPISDDTASEEPIGESSSFNLDDILNTPISEGIELGGEDKSEPKADDKGEDGDLDDLLSAPIDGGESSDASEGDDKEDVNDVTSEVLDKVAEAEEPVGEEPATNETITKDQLLKKMNSLTKSVADVSNSVLKLDS